MVEICKERKKTYVRRRPGNGKYGNEEGGKILANIQELEGLGRKEKVSKQASMQTKRKQK